MGGSGCRADERVGAGGDPGAHRVPAPINAELTERGELVDAQGLTGPEAAKFVIYGGTGDPVITDGPFAEYKELLAGYRIIDVESLERAIEIAADGVGRAGSERRRRSSSRSRCGEVHGPAGPDVVSSAA